MNVVVYTMPGCPGCAHTKEFLAHNGVRYSERNVSDDQKAREELIAIGARAVPVIKVDARTIVGFDEQKLRDLLGLKERPFPQTEKPVSNRVKMLAAFARRFDREH